MAGHSGKPLWQKLGIKSEMRCILLNGVPNYQELLGPEVPNVDWLDILVPQTEFVHVFATQKAVLFGVLTNARSSIASNGMVWVSWPKKSSGQPSEITEDTIRSLALPMGFVDVKVCSVSEVWSGLKLVIRKELR
ncbi:MAG: DUF3052 family protein [Paracoccaceae bacterium]|nr:DUF3052 family protein [Paracoccaceae bacterium]MDG1737830.1 DUF3052 family protein [Paracoccaceae bacterium]MDG2260079.1 DUF3052 family protein [Paracoccaceae bacterium]